jgi:glycosyltransferase involved in cell wall biosynthesis
MSNILFVLGGLGMGGVETYITRLAEQLAVEGHQISVLLLSDKADAGLHSRLSASATVTTIEWVPFFGPSSWINAMLPVFGEAKSYDLVHVVDVLTFAFVLMNRTKIKASAISVGIYHSKEITWWRNRDVYFRKVMLRAYDDNFDLNIFPNESTAAISSRFVSASSTKTPAILPLGIDLTKYAQNVPSQKSLKIVSVGRLVDFKTYNKNIITILPELLKHAAFEYHIYGDGPERSKLMSLCKDLNVSSAVHFHGEINYNSLGQALNNIFCFVGSGTTIIEASASGVPSLVGIESIDSPLTCGWFSDIKGYSYNEAEATQSRLSIASLILSLSAASAEDYQLLSLAHIAKANEFDLKATASNFLTLSSQSVQNFCKINRWRALGSFIYSIIRFGPSALKRRFDA